MRCRLIVLITMSIFAVLGATLFAVDQDEKFGTFSRAWFTLFQVLTLACAR